MIQRNKYVEKVVSYVRENPGDGLKVSDLLDMVPWSRRALELAFKAETGMTVHQFIIRARVERMTELMAQGLTPTEAADELGTDYNTIARNFKTLTGLTPAEYSEKHTLLSDPR